MPSLAPLSFVQNRAKAARRPTSIYFYDDHVNGKVEELRKCLKKGCSYESAAYLVRGALRIAGAKGTRQWFDKYCSIISDISSRKPEQRKCLFCYFSDAVDTNSFELNHLDHIERMLSSIGSAHSHYGLFLFNRFISGKMHNMNSQWGARRALPESEVITQADVDVLCRLVNLIVSKCNGTSESSISMLAALFSKNSFSLGTMPYLEAELSGFNNGFQIPRYLEKVKSTFA
jgi:hypothetical protein